MLQPLDQSLEEASLSEIYQESLYLVNGNPIVELNSDSLCPIENLKNHSQMVTHSPECANMNGHEQGNINNHNMGLKEFDTDTMVYAEDKDALFVRLQSASDEQNSLSSYSPVSSPDVGGCMSSPGIFSEDSQISLVHRSEGLAIMDEMSHLSSEDVLSCWTNSTDNSIFIVTEPTSETPAKIRKNSQDSDITSSTMLSALSSVGYDLSDAVSSSEFIFTKFGQEPANGFTLGSNSTLGATKTSDAVSVRSSACIQMPTSKKFKEPTLNQPFPSKHGKFELEILVQPENQHRARYLTEGSRGAVKDQSGEGHPMVKLNGYSGPCKLQVFVGLDTGKPKPHGFYQACKVCGKNSTVCSERDMEGITVIDIDFDPADDMIIKIDCVGILKLRNADVEHMIGVSGKAKKKSTKARMVFRVSIPKPDGSFVTLQTTSAPILCTQPVGTPEICRQSLSLCPVTGGSDLFIIGKNFGKGIKVIFREKTDDKVTWQEQAPVETDFFQTTHLICKVPKYKIQNILEPVTVELVLHCAGKFSEPSKFTYSPVFIEPKTEPTSASCSQPNPENELLQEFKTTAVSPEALALNRLIQMQVESTTTTTSIFQIPVGVGICSSQSSAMDSATSVTSSDGAGFGLLSSSDKILATPYLPTTVQSMTGIETSQLTHEDSKQFLMSDAIVSLDASVTHNNTEQFLLENHTPLDMPVTHMDSSNNMSLDAPVSHDNAKSVLHETPAAVPMETPVGHDNSKPFLLENHVAAMNSANGQTSLQALPTISVDDVTAILQMPNANSLP